MAISIEKWISESKGNFLSNPPGNKGAFKGQCVSLVQDYIYKCFDIPFKAMGNAKDWVKFAPMRILDEGAVFVYFVDIPEKGDIVVWPAPYGGGYGHIAVYIDKNTIFDQNNMSHDDGAAGYGRLFGKNVAKYMRVNRAKIFDEFDETIPSFKPQVSTNSSTFDMWDQKMQYRVYTVQKGETLGTIAKNMGYGDDWQMIYDFHNDLALKGVENVHFIENPHWINVGDKILIPIFI